MLSDLLLGTTGKEESLITEKVEMVMKQDREDTLANRLQDLLSENGISLEEFALQTSLDRDVFVQWLSGDSQPDSAEVQELAEYFGCPVQWLTTGEVGNGGPEAPRGDLVQKGVAVTVDEFEGVSLGANLAMRDLQLWIGEQDDGINYWEVLKAKLAVEFPEFREWLQQRYSGRE